MSLALALCMLVLAASSFGNYGRLIGLDDIRQPAVQTLHASTGVVGKPSGNGDHAEVLVARLDKFARPDPQPALTIFPGQVVEKPALAPAFNARAPPRSEAPLVTG